MPLPSAAVLLTGPAGVYSASEPEIASSPAPPCIQSLSQPPNMMSSELFASNSGWSRRWLPGPSTEVFGPRL
jgi:hypothetical protein